MDDVVDWLQPARSTARIPAIIGVSCGRDGTDSVSPDDYASPYEFTGKRTRVTLDVSGDVVVDDEAELQRLMTQQ